MTLSYDTDLGTKDNNVLRLIDINIRPLHTAEKYSLFYRFPLVFVKYLLFYFSFANNGCYTMARKLKEAEI